MMSKGPTVVKEFPQSYGLASRKAFLAEIQRLTRESYRPQIVVDLSKSRNLSPEAIDLLLDCVEHVERADGRVIIAAGSPETAILLELTRLDSVVDMFSSVSEAIGGETVPPFEQYEGPQPLAA
jgi:anti-anti-sigma regulatory factor